MSYRLVNIENGRSYGAHSGRIYAGYEINCDPEDSEYGKCFDAADINVAFRYLELIGGDAQFLKVKEFQ